MPDEQLPWPMPVEVEGVHVVLVGAGLRNEEVHLQLLEAQVLRQAPDPVATRADGHDDFMLADLGRDAWEAGASKVRPSAVVSGPWSVVSLPPGLAGR